MGFLEKIASAFKDTNAVAFTIEFIFMLALFYFIMYTLKSNNAELLNIIFVFFILITGIVFILVDGVASFFYILFPIIYVIAMVCMFSTEIKRIIWNLGTKKNIDARHQVMPNEKADIKNCINEIIKALQDMSKNDIGALIILASAPIPSSILESGVQMDCEISAALIESVFFPKTPLHDGAMVIKKNKIVSAGCFLPLSRALNIPKDLGTRHRAGLGITETIDVIAIIVSEETGVISIAKGGKIKRYADSEMLRQTLVKFYQQEYAQQK